MNYGRLKLNIEGILQEKHIDKMQIFINLYIFKVIKIISIKFYKRYLKIGFVKI